VLSVSDQELAKALMQEGLVTLGQVQEAAQQRGAGKSLGDVLVAMGLITKEQLAEYAPAEPAGKGTAVDLAHIKIDTEALMLVDRETCVKLQFIPLGVQGGTLRVAMANATDLPAQDEISRVTGKRVEAVAATIQQIMEVVNRCYTSAAMSRAADAASATVGSAGIDNVEDVQELVDQAPTVRIVNAILEEAVKQGASDVHVEPRGDGLYLRYRVDGVLRPPRKLDKPMQAPILSRLKILAGLDIAEMRMPQDGRFRLTLQGRQIDFRTSSLPCYHGEKIVLRLLDKSALKAELSDLGFLPEIGKLFEELVMRPQGMILVTGPTGSGKSTTLYAALNRCKSETKNVVTVEDPVEYQLEGINQTQVHYDIGLDFATQLRAILRQDPDVILVGEIRDRDTAEMAFRAALTGHLVLSTLHTNDASSAPVRLVDMQVEPYLIAASVIAILAQRLVRTICKHCREPYEPSSLDLDRIGLTPTDAAKIKFYHGVGCNNCGHTGFAGRLGIYEVLVMSEPIRKAIFAGATTMEIRRLAVTHRMRTLRDDGLVKIAKGLTTPDELSRVLFEFLDEEADAAEAETAPPVVAPLAAPAPG